MCQACIVGFDTSRCRKSTDLSWDGGEANTPADGEDHSVEVREPTPPPQVDAVVEPVIVEATLVEGMCPATTGSRHVW
jgi:hypothetical protein